MKQLKILLFSLLALAVLPANAANVLFGYDSFLGPDGVTPALAAGGHTVTTHMDDWTSFNSDLAGGNWDAVIILVQNSGNGVDLGALTTYVNGGGKAIFTDWNMDPAFATLFEASYTGNENDSTATFDPVIGAVNPVTINNPGWGTYSMGLAPIGGGQSLCTASPSGDSCLVLGNGGNTLILGFLADIFDTATDQVIAGTVSAVLAPAGPPAPVPTISAWHLALLAGIVGLLGAYQRRRK